MTTAASRLAGQGQELRAEILAAADGISRLRLAVNLYLRTVADSGRLSDRSGADKLQQLLRASQSSITESAGLLPTV